MGTMASWVPQAVWVLVVHTFWEGCILAFSEHCTCFVAWVA